MLDKFKSYLQFGNRFCGIEHTTKNGEELIVATLLKKHKNQIDFEDSFEASSIKEIINFLPKRQHITLAINNANVITKTIKGSLNDSLKVVYKAFPNINLNDFYFEVIEQSKNSFVSICRKEYIDNLIEEYTKANVPIINFSLGNMIVSSISKFAKNEEKLTSSNALIPIENKEILDIEKTEIESENKLDINGLTVTNIQLLSFSGALNTVLKEDNTSTNYDDQKQFLKNEYNNTRIFNQFLKFGGLFLLGLFLVNFLFFNHYFNNVNTLQQASQINLSAKEKVVTLNESVNKTKEMVDNMLKSNSSKSSFYTNAIIQSLPSSILLSEVNYQPLIKRIKADKIIELEHNIILVSGDSNSSESFSKWINDLEINNWIDSIEIIEYSDVSKSKSVFSIKIKMIND